VVETDVVATVVRHVGRSDGEDETLQNLHIKERRTLCDVRANLCGERLGVRFGDELSLLRACDFVLVLLVDEMR
jgi:hypothetical protein